MSTAALDAARSSGLIQAGEPLLVMLSGGADSICLLDVALRLGADVRALHVNYRLRDDADDDEQHCRDLCGRLGVELLVERAEITDDGNLHALARAERYRLAERHASGDYAAAHTASDQAETILYRLAVSPGRRALLGMEPRRGPLVRPLLDATRGDTEAHCRAHGLEWREDPSNRDPRFARARVRHGLLADLADVAPHAERTIAETASQLRDEADVLDVAVAEALDRLGGGPAVEAAALAALGPALARLVLRRLAERELGASRSMSRAEADAILGLATGGSRSLDLGQGLRAIAEYGTVRFRVGDDAAAPGPVTLAVPGGARFGEWTVEARAGGGGEVELLAEALGAAVTVRGWRDGDRMRPLGLGGSKSLQDLFTDRKVPRALRRSLPIVEADGEIAWVAGVAVGERFAAASGAGARVGLTARRAGAA
jgi:tRNA(Ile)-lysidine synthase